MVTEKDLEDLSKAMDTLKDRVRAKADVQEINRAIDTLRIKISDFEGKLRAPEPAPAAPGRRGP